MPALRPSILIALPLLAAILTAPQSAEACGGTFCDSGPRAMPVDQKGENILFVMEPGKVEAHIQIQYKGEASRFAWVLPVPALPEVEVGSQALFQNLLAGTVPSFALASLNDCGFSGGGVLNGGAQNGGPPSIPIDGGGGGTTVVLQKTVGSFEITVLQGGSAQEVADWLNSNGYAMPPNAPELLQGYVVQRFLFVAVKLTGGAGLDEIHPLVVRYAGTEPCVPLKLTAVAAVQNMGVRTFFLGNHRVVPKSYKHVVLNPVMLNWLNFAVNYEEAISGGADSPVANGHAFVTEYAGSPSVVSQGGLVSPQWSASPFIGADPLRVIELLKQQGLITFCGGGTCTYAHPLVLPLLREFLPAPAGVDEGGFYDCVACYASQVDRTKWGDGTAFARALEERVIVPGRHASDLLMTYSYLTRMYTTISPAEMTDDPTFEERDGLPQVGALRTATQHTICNGRSGVVLPDGREVGLAPADASAPGGVSWPTFTQEMPWVERIEEFPSAPSLEGGAAPLVLVDNREKIDGLLKAWNDSVGWVPLGLDAGPTAGGGFAGAGGTGPEPDGGLGLAADSGGGCGCEIPGRSPDGSAGWALSGLLGLLLAGRRPRRRHAARPA